MKNKAMYLMENRKLEMTEIEMPTCKSHEVVVKIEYCGVCGSDVHNYELGEPNFPDMYPFILGHECAGEVVEVGSDVTNLVVGDKVAIEPGITCGKCEWCKEGKYNLCPNVDFLSAPMYHGALRNYLSHPADLCFKLPDNVLTVEGALIEPLAVGLCAAVKSEIRVGQSAVVLGAGCIGLVTLLSLKGMGISDITVIDLFQNRLDKALELGATHVINATNENVVDAVKSITNKRGVDFVYETAGSKVTAAQSIELAKRGGTVMMIGNVVGETPFNFQLLVDKEINILSTFRYRNIYPVAIEMLSSGRVDIKTIITKIYDFEDSSIAFEDCIENKQTVVKSVIKISE